MKQPVHMGNYKPLMIEIYSEFKTSDMHIQYIRDVETSVMGLRILPLGMDKLIAEHREDISNQKEAQFFKNWGGYPKAAVVEPLVQLSCAGDSRGGGFSQGTSMHNSSTTAGLCFKKQETIPEGNYTIVETELISGSGIKVFHLLKYNTSSPILICRSTVENTANTTITLELLTSFTLGNITPFDPADAPERLHLHRFRSSWSAEGYHMSQPLEELGLESSWSNHGVRCERFGQLGSMPVRGWFPTAAIEDRKAGVFWGVQLDAPASWQIEVFRKDDFANLSGGLCDREFGHWSKQLSPGESFTSPEASITTTSGGIDDLCQRLLERQRETTIPVSEAEADCPVVYNEWCTSWGKPAARNIIKSLPFLKRLNIGYYVIDAGWYADSSGSWETSHGDWNVSDALFPEGLSEVCAKIREQGMIPGLWYEFETAGKDSAAARNTEMLITRDKTPVRAGDRYFLDFRKKAVIEYLHKKVIGRLKEAKIGYLKIDYNETIGFGCDDENQADGPAEGLRRQINGVQDFFNSIRDEVPGIVMENCSSGGHRAEPSFINITDMTSFSDAHETVNIPVIAANLNRLIIPRKCLIWAVLHSDDSIKRLHYSLSAAFLGRMCLSGEITGLDEERFEIVRKAVEAYQKAAAMIDYKIIHRFGDSGKSTRYPKGWQAVVKTSEFHRDGLAVIHTFENSPESITVKLEETRAGWIAEGLFAEPRISCRVDGSSLEITGLSDFSGLVIYIRKEEKDSETKF